MCLMPSGDWNGMSTVLITPGIVVTSVDWKRKVSEMIVMSLWPCVNPNSLWLLAFLYGPLVGVPTSLGGGGGRRRFVATDYKEPCYDPTYFTYPIHIHFNMSTVYLNCIHVFYETYVNSQRVANGYPCKNNITWSITWPCIIVYSEGQEEIYYAPITNTNSSIT